MTANIVTTGEHANGISAQSIGGGGGDGGVRRGRHDFDRHRRRGLDMAGSGPGGGVGGTVTVADTAASRRPGRSHGIFAQSIGGGGGDGGMAVTGGISAGSGQIGLAFGGAGGAAVTRRPYR